MDKVIRPVFLLTDFGVRDHYAAQVRGVLENIAPGLPVHDISHQVDPFAVDEGAWLLETTLPWLPASAVVLAVVDPGVGTERQALAIESGGRTFVGPDNGLLSAALGATDREAGRLVSESIAVRVIAVPREARVSPTFHGRDVFAPAAARLASGMPLDQVGPPTEPHHLLPPFRAVGSDAGHEGRVIHVDRYGNLITTVTAGQAGSAYAITLAGVSIEGPARTFADAPPGRLLTHIDSSGFVAVAQNQGSAAVALCAGRGAAVTVTRR